MAKQNLDFNHYDQAVRFLNQAREAERFKFFFFTIKTSKVRILTFGLRMYAYDGGFMASCLFMA